MLLIVQKSFLCNRQRFEIFQSEWRTNPYGDTRRNNEKGKLPQKRQFTPVLHRKRHTRRSFIRSFCVCPCGGGKGIRTLARLLSNGFQDRLVMTASISLRMGAIKQGAPRFTRSILSYFCRFVNPFWRDFLGLRSDFWCFCRRACRMGAGLRRGGVAVWHFWCRIMSDIVKDARLVAECAWSYYTNSIWQFCLI